MTITQFHNALFQGRGKCILAVRSDPEKYRKEVMWACRELTSFDTQCEGSKSWYIHEMVGCYDDPSPFVNAACDALINWPSDGSWHVYCLSELLEWFVRDGNQTAWKTLLFKYRQLYHEMRHVGPPEDCYWAALDDYRHLCLILSWCRDHFLDIARDIGRLSLETQWLKEYEFDWLYATRGKRYFRSLCRAAGKDPYLAEFLRVHEEAWQEHERQRANRKRRRLPPHCQDSERIGAALLAYQTAVTPEEKAEALDAFHWFPYPGDPAPVIADAQSEDEKLHDTAWRALENVRHPAVREFALSKLDSEENAFGVFVTNYVQQDEERLMSHLRSLTVDFECTTWWHRDQLDVLRMDERKPLAPKAALQYILDTTYCSCCRENALTQMGRRHMLTTELLEECLLDSNDDIRTYARRALNRRKAK